MVGQRQPRQLVLLTAYLLYGYDSFEIEKADSSEAAASNVAVGFSCRRISRTLMFESVVLCFEPKLGIWPIVFLVANG